MTFSAVPLQTGQLHGQTERPDIQTFLLRVNLATLGVLPGTGSPALASLIKYFCTWLATWFKEGRDTHRGQSSISLLAAPCSTC